MPILDSIDPIDRAIDFMPSKSPYDPRHMLAGHVDGSNQWISGFFDKDSFTETLAGWGKTVVVGRARYSVNIISEITVGDWEVFPWES